MPNYLTKADLKKATGVDTLDFAQKTDLANLESDVDKVHIDKQKILLSGWSNFFKKLDKLDRNYNSWFKEANWCTKKWSCQKDWI